MALRVLDALFRRSDPRSHAAGVDHGRQTVDEVRPGLCDAPDQPFEVPRKPEVVVAEEGNVAPPGHSQTVIVRNGLGAGVAGEVVPVQAWVVETPHDGLTAVSAGIANNERLEVVERLRKQALQSK